MVLWFNQAILCIISVPSKIARNAMFVSHYTYYPPPPFVLPPSTFLSSLLCPSSTSFLPPPPLHLSPTEKDHYHMYIGLLMWLSPSCCCAHHSYCGWSLPVTPAAWILLWIGDKTTAVLHLLPWSSLLLFSL